MVLFFLCWLQGGIITLPVERPIDQPHEDAQWPIQTVRIHTRALDADVQALAQELLVTTGRLRLLHRVDLQRHRHLVEALVVRGALGECELF